MSSFTQVQACLQLAFHWASDGRGAVSTYESASTAHFISGRTETIRSASAEAAAFVQSVASNASREEQVARLRASAGRHAALAKEAARGDGIDRHLYALRALAEGQKSAAGAGGSGEAASHPSALSAAAFFADPTYHAVTSNELSTSTLTDPFSRQAAFGPVHAEGYGVSYHLPSTRLKFCVTTYAPRDSGAFAGALERALLHVQDLMAAGDTAP